MTTHWSGTNNTFPLPSISTSTPMPSPISTYPCFFCDNAFYNIRELASHLITSHGPNLHSALCPRAADDSLRKSVAAFLNEFAASGAAFVSLCDCFPGHPAHTQTTTPSTTHMLNGLETTSPNTSAYASSMLFSPPPCTFIWPSLQPTNPTAIADGHYTAFYTNAAWVQIKSNTSEDPFYTSSPAENTTWPPIRVLDISSASSGYELSPCERAVEAAAAARKSPLPVLGKRKRSAYDSGLGSSVSGTSSPPPSNITPKISEFLVSEGVTQFGKRVYLYPFEPSAAP
ncbi:hypothetical protein KCV03_g6263, partial [Aureobasidium melanogenum]